MSKEFICSECPSAFAKSFTLRRHYRQFHPMLEPPTLKDISKFICEECNKRFSFHTNLVRHLEKFHSVETSSLSLPLNPEKFKCMKCSAEYKNSKCLKRHERLNHSISVTSLIPKNYICGECGAKYTNNTNLKRHERLKHSNLATRKFNMLNCSLCSTLFFTQKDDLFRHWELEHAINIETEELELKDKDIFLTWKNNVEINTKSKFVRSIPGFSSKSGETVYFICNRSGYFSSKSKGLRNLKTQGTCKINSFCPARMKVRILENGVHEVHFTKTHVGHGHDLGHISLTQSQREILASKIASDITFDDILNDVKESILSDEMFGRIHLLTRKDLHNIKQSFNIMSNVIKQEVKQVIVSEFSEAEGQNSIETNNLIYKEEDSFLLKSSLASTSSTCTEDKSIESMKKKVNDYYQRLTASASSCEELEVISNLLEKAKPLMDAIRSSNGESA